VLVCEIVSVRRRLPIPVEIGKAGGFERLCVLQDFSIFQLTSEERK